MTDTQQSDEAQLWIDNLHKFYNEAHAQSDPGALTIAYDKGWYDSAKRREEHIRQLRAENAELRDGHASLEEQIEWKDKMIHQMSEIDMEAMELEIARLRAELADEQEIARVRIMALEQQVRDLRMELSAYQAAHNQTLAPGNTRQRRRKGEER